MKTNVLLLLVTIAVATALAVGLYRTQRRAVQERSTAATAEQRLTAQIAKVTSDLNELRVVNATLRTGMDERVGEMSSLSNQLAAAKADLANVQALLEKAEAKTRSVQETAKNEIEARDRKITGLEGEKDELTRQMNALSEKIAGLEKQIADFRRQITDRHGDRGLLLTQIRELQAQKLELERKFQDTDFLREEYRRRKEEEAVARRQSFARKGLFGFSRKGAELVKQGVQAKPPVPIAQPPPLEVELDISGGARVVSPTNDTPAAVPQP